MTTNQLTDEQWQKFTELGFVKLGKPFGDNFVIPLQQRIDEIMLGKAHLDYDKVLMQLDTDSGEYKDAPPQTKGHKGATLNYRKVQNLEYDPLFLDYLQQPLLQDACMRAYPDCHSVAIFRAMFMNKPANQGTFLPWHQDRWNILDRDPIMTVWTALDPATIENGCVQIIPGSHKLGLINPESASGFLSEQQTKKYCPEENVLFLELAAGETVLLHNWVLHSSDFNRSSQSRRAFSTCYMDAETIDSTSQSYSVVFGKDALTLA